MIVLEYSEQLQRFNIKFVILTAHCTSNHVNMYAAIEGL